MGWFPCCLLLSLICFGACAAENRFVQDRFGIGLWSDPPIDNDADSRYAEIAEANFTFVIGIFGASSTEAVTRQLSLCEKHGLKGIVSMAGLSPERLPKDDSCWGYFLADEPSPGAFGGLRKTVDSLREARPGKLAYINLYPNYVPAWAIGNTSYVEHVSQFIREVHPDVLSMDHYPHFLPNADGHGAYCDNLAVMREQSLAANIPFWNFFNTMPFGDHSDPTEAQLRWQIYTSVAYGAKGVMYFCYWTPAGAEFPKGGAILTRAGKKTRHYEEAKRINAVLKNWGPTLMKLSSTGVYHCRPEDDSATVLNGTPLRSLTPGDYLVGVFKHADGRRGILLNNYHFAYSAWPTATFDARSNSVVEVSGSTGKEIPVVDDSPDIPGLQISLDAGEGRLFLLPAEQAQGPESK
ncbi:MAG TPA: beta-galactosidase [Candidatus Dormibacteraeota bacterium]|nr:beta-galactosidase [Candidatus Dormibacteraeota bacterium]